MFVLCKITILIQFFIKIVFNTKLIAVIVQFIGLLLLSFRYKGDVFNMQLLF